MAVAIKRIAVTEETFNLLKVRAHYGQALGGVVAELLDNSEYNYIEQVNGLLSNGSLKKCQKHNTLFLAWENCPMCKKETP
jgi:hypothetical protein